MNTARTILFGLLLAAGIGVRPAVARAANEVIGYVNLQRAIIETEDGKRAKKKLEATFKKKQKALRAKEEELDTMKKRLEGSAMKKDDPEAKAQVMEFQRKFVALRETLVKEQQELKKLEGDALSKITTKLRGIIKQIGKSGGYTLIIEAQESSLLFAKPHLDLTNEVIRKYNQSSAKGRKGKAK